MGQLALGFRSLLIKAAVFVVLAALLAWALGGTLWPRPQVAQMAPVEFANQQWHWQLAVGGARTAPSWVRWTMMVSSGNGPAVARDNQHWIDVAGPVVSEQAIYFAGRTSEDATARWHLHRVDRRGELQVQELTDRLAVELQLARIAAGLSLQDPTQLEQWRHDALLAD